MDRMGYDGIRHITIGKGKEGKGRECASTLSPEDRVSGRG